MSDSNTVTFANSDAFAGIWVYSYVLITFVIVVGAYYFAGKVRLYYESYVFLQEIEQELGVITLGINALVMKHGLVRDAKQDKQRKTRKIDMNSVKRNLRNGFATMHQLLIDHENELLDKINSIPARAAKHAKKFQTHQYDDKRSKHNKNDNEKNKKCVLSC